MQQHGSKYFANKPPLPLTIGVGLVGKPFHNMVMLHIKLMESQMQQHGSK